MGYFLKPDNVREELGLTIKEKIIPKDAIAFKDVSLRGDYCLKGMHMKPNYPLMCGGIGVTVHNTIAIVQAKGTTKAEQYTRSTWPNCNMGGVIVHYYVDEVEAWQNLREDEQGWHATDYLGPGNTQTIAVEIIMDGSGSPTDKKAEDNGAKLVASILHRHGWGIEDVYQHHHWFEKNCPMYIRPHWNKFVDTVQKYLDSFTDNNDYKVQYRDLYNNLVTVEEKGLIDD